MVGTKIKSGLHPVSQAPGARSSGRWLPKAMLLWAWTQAAGEVNVGSLPPERARSEGAPANINRVDGEYGEEGDQRAEGEIANVVNAPEE